MNKSVLVFYNTSTPNSLPVMAKTEKDIACNSQIACLSISERHSISFYTL